MPPFIMTGDVSFVTPKVVPLKPALIKPWITQNITYILNVSSNMLSYFFNTLQYDLFHSTLLNLPFHTMSHSHCCQGPTRQWVLLLPARHTYYILKNINVSTIDFYCWSYYILHTTFLLIDHTTYIFIIDFVLH